jgi:hypothetical protein
VPEKTPTYNDSQQIGHDDIPRAGCCTHGLRHSVNLRCVHDYSLTLVFPSTNGHSRPLAGRAKVMLLLPGDPQPTTSFPLAGACARRSFYQPGNAVRYVPQSIPRCWVTLVYRQIPIGSVAAKQSVVTACLTRQWRCMGETYVRFVRSSPRHRERSWWVHQSRTPLLQLADR